MYGILNNERKKKFLPKTKIHKKIKKCSRHREQIWKNFPWYFNISYQFKPKMAKIFSKNREFEILTRNELVWREPLELLVYHIWKHSNQYFWRSWKYQFWPRMTKIFTEKLRFCHEMNKSEREPPKVLVYQIWKHSGLWFWRRNRKYQFWLNMTKIFIKNREFEIFARNEQIWE